MERRYIAFISYRHLPLEMAVAKKLHKRIERYVIPKDLRRDGQKKLGLVFRDQDELPISSNLSDNIRQALDNSQFLIVICTPETAKSPWVLREIGYFLEHHDREHVLAVLADGTPETAFPPPLTELRSPDGDLLERIEPLAANIVADSAAKRARLFRVESLRILAALTGCPFDALFRREQRYRRRRAAAAASAAAVVAAAFIALLLNRNAQIRAQLQRALINESRTLSALSEQAYREGDYNGALRYALQALPGEGRERPYVAEAEYALSRELDLYRKDEMRYRLSLEQDTVISLTALSEDGSLLATSDEYGTLRCRDLTNGELLWERHGGLVLLLRFYSSDSALLVLGADGIASVSARNGETLWQREDIFPLDFAAVTNDGRTGLLTSFFVGDGSEERFTLLDLESGTMLDDAAGTDGAARFCAAGALSDDQRLAALLLQRSDETLADLYLWQTDGDELRLIAEGFPYSAGATAYRLLFTPDGDLLLGCDDHNGPSSLRLFERANGWTPRFETEVETEKLILEADGSADSFPGIDLFDCVGDRAVFGCKHELCMLDLRDGTVLWHRTLNGFLRAAKLYENACLGLVVSDGTVSFCSDEGYLSDSMGFSNFRSGYVVSLAAITGESFPSCSVVLVPADYPQRVSLVRFTDDPQLVSIGAFSLDVRRVIPISSPSGELVFCLGYDPTGKPAEALLLDIREGESGEAFPLPEDGGWEDPGLLILTEDGRLLSPRGVLDVFSHSFTETEQNALPAAGQEGAVVSVFDVEKGLSAVWDGERLVIRDNNSGKEIVCDGLPLTTVKLLFTDSGEELLAFSETGELCVIRCADGALLHCSQHSALGLHFRDAGARYTLASAAKEDRLLIFYDDITRSEAICLVYDRESRSCAGAYDAVAAYFPERDAVLVCPMTKGVCISPFRSRAEIIAAAEQLLESELPEADG